MRRLFQLLLLCEALSTLLSAVACFVAPEAMMGSLLGGPGSADALALLPHTGASWVLPALLLLLCLRLGPGEEASLRRMLLPVLVGDLVHTIAVFKLVQHTGIWSPGALGGVGLTALYFVYRGALCWRPALLLGPAEPR
jgi:hypothetical protein